jgi:hypothetical protein
MLPFIVKLKGCGTKVEILCPNKNLGKDCSGWPEQAPIKEL